MTGAAAPASPANARPLDAIDVFVRLAHLRAACGLGALHVTPGLWTVAVDLIWWVALNGHHRPLPLPARHMPPTGAVLPPLACYVERDGHPWALLTYGASTFIQDAESELPAFVAALDRAIAAARA